MSDTSVSPRVNGYHDFGGLAGLRGDAANGEKAALRETARQFEAYFLEQVMKTMREAVERSDLVDSHDSDQFQEMMDKEVALKMAERGSLGLANMLERTMQQRLQPTAAEALSARDRAWPPRTEAIPLGQGGAAGLPLAPRAPGALPLKVQRLVKGVGHE